MHCEQPLVIEINDLVYLIILGKHIPSPISLQTRKEWFSANETKIKRFWNATAEVRNAKMNHSLVILGRESPSVSVSYF